MMLTYEDALKEWARQKYLPDWCTVTEIEITEHEAEPPQQIGDMTWDSGKPGHYEVAIVYRDSNKKDDQYRTEWYYPDTQLEFMYELFRIGTEGTKEA